MHIFIMLLLSLIVGAPLAAKVCNIADVKEFYNFVTENNPAIREVEQDQKVLDAQIELAKQRPNPYIDMQAFNDDKQLLNTRIFNFSVQHIVELGDKRQKRIHLAQAAKSLNNSKLGLELYNSNTRYMLYYQRAGQLKLLIKSVQEAIDTFDDIIGKLSRRKRLTPQEKVSLSTLEIAGNGYKLQLNTFENELRVLMGEIQFVAKCEQVSPIYRTLIFPKDWSNNDNDKDQEFRAEKTFGLMKLEDLKLKLVDSQLEVEKSLGYSNLEIGPNLKYTHSNSNNPLLIGISVTFDLPILNTNDGGKSQAMAKIYSQRIKAKNRKDLLNIRKDRLIQKYKSSLGIYKNLPTLKDLSGKHYQVERYFSRGIVSIPMTIESHRQQIKFLRSRFKVETELIMALAEISSIDGNQSIFERIKIRR